MGAPRQHLGRRGDPALHNGEALPETTPFTGPIFSSDAFLAIGVNSLYTFAANRTAFHGAIDEVYLYNYALPPESVRQCYLSDRFQITAVNVEGNDLRVTWACAPGSSYVVQTSTSGTAGFAMSFVDATAPIVIPLDYQEPTKSFLDAGALPRSKALFYRVKRLP